MPVSSYDVELPTSLLVVIIVAQSGRETGGDRRGEEEG